MMNIAEKCIKGIEEIAKIQAESGDEEGVKQSIDAIMSIVNVKKEKDK